MTQVYDSVTPELPMPKLKRSTAVGYIKRSAVIERSVAIDYSEPVEPPTVLDAIWKRFTQLVEMIIDH